MKTRIFYLFAIGICALLALILIWVVVFRGNQPTVPSEKNRRVMQARNPNARQARIPKAVQERNQQTPPITPFQFITDKLNKMDITVKGVDVDIKNGIVKWGSHSKWGEYYGKPSSESQAIAPSILQLHEAIKANPQNIRGCYQTKWGLLRLYMKDDVVTGTLNYYGPTHFIGKLKDNILVGTWIRPAHNKRPMLVGPMQFAFVNNWSAFRSVWRYKKAPELNNKWVGKKIQCPAMGTKLEQKLVPGGPGVPAKPEKDKTEQAKPGKPVGEKKPQKKLPTNPTPVNQ